MATALPDVVPEEDTDTRTRRQPPYAVILHNDDLNTMEFVIVVLRKVFGYEVEKCVELMLEAHEKGRAVVWTGALEVAELKADQIRSCGADPLVAHRGAQPLGVSVEPARLEPTGKDAACRCSRSAAPAFPPRLFHRCDCASRSSPRSRWSSC
ncbi:MAG TPA: ATP-dependent Clp protease adaptor ClpS [Gemmataceae bacterium]|nr:ATP-dependent Clp protease adaptor ClpS [Gemmataceae bacterium]